MLLKMLSSQGKLYVLDFWKHSIATYVLQLEIGLRIVLEITIGLVVGLVQHLFSMILSSKTGFYENPI